MIYFEKLHLAGFRNFIDETIPFSLGKNIILGDNGQGKSNLLEALYFLCTGKSFRTTHTKELIHFDKEGFYLEAHLEKQGIKHTITIEFSPHKKKLTIDNTSYNNLHPLIGFLPAVIMTPEMKKIIDQGPVERRKFIDFLGSQLSRAYFEAITRYHKALKQRNAALKLQQQTHMWEKILAKEWLFIYAQRSILIEKLQARAQKHLKLPNAALHLHYSPCQKGPFHSIDQLLAIYEKHRSQEKHLGTSLCGPHRDEILIHLNGCAADSSASEGQKKMLIAALALASYDLLKEELGIEPLFLIDDYDAHFDLVRKDWILIALSSIEQTFITSPLNELNHTQGVLRIQNGKILK